jgi:hypothetical protein
LLLLGCNECYPGGFLSLTNYKIGNYILTPGGIKVYNNYTEVDLNLIDTKVDELEKCLGVEIHRSCFSVLIPDDWFVSSCSGEQMLPVAAPYKQCEDKGLYLEEKCRGLSRPTLECPCVCTYRVALQDDYFIVSPPNLKLFKVDLARLVTNVNNPWKDPNISKCVN